MKVFRTKTNKLAGTNFREVHRNAIAIYEQIVKKTKRRVYIRSVYFKRSKVFLGLFLQHLFDNKNWRDRMRRMKYFPCALELIRDSHIEPISKENPNKRTEILHRFAGVTRGNDLFFVQIKENKNNGQKYLISIFPVDQWK